MLLVRTQVIGIETLASAGACRFWVVVVVVGEVLLKRHVVAGRVMHGHVELKVERRIELNRDCDNDVIGIPRGNLHQPRCEDEMLVEYDILGTEWVDSRSP